MDTVVVVLQGAIVVYLTALARYLPRYVEKKAQNLATKEDISEITALTEAARLPYAAVLERFREDVKNNSATLTRRQEFYIELAQATTLVFASGHPTTDQDKQRFLSAYSAAFLYAPDEIVTAINAHIDLQIRYAAADPNTQESLQESLRTTLARLLVLLRREAFHPTSDVAHTMFRFVRF